MPPGNVSSLVTAAGVFLVHFRRRQEVTVSSLGFPSPLLAMPQPPSDLLSTPEHTESHISMFKIPVSARHHPLPTSLLGEPQFISPAVPSSCTQVASPDLACAECVGSSGCWLPAMP